MFKYNHWEVAYRKEGEPVFKVVPNPSWGWAADPFLVELHGKMYIFAELFLYKSERNGVIGYCEIKDNSASEWQVSMDRKWHLSYPNVWVEEGKLFMCPESAQLEEVSIYELAEFPDKWIKKKTLVNNAGYRDTTFFTFESRDYMLTFERDYGGVGFGKGLIFRIKDGAAERVSCFSDNPVGNRCGGNVICENGKSIRVAQDCDGKYGKGLVFYQIDSVEPDYKEHEIKRLYADDILTDAGRKYIGIHTYNKLSGIEVIDLKYSEKSMAEYFAKKRVRKVFLNKY